MRFRVSITITDGSYLTSATHAHALIERDVDVDITDYHAISDYIDDCVSDVSSRVNSEMSLRANRARELDTPAS